MERGGSQNMTIADEVERGVMTLSDKEGVRKPQKLADMICEQPITL